MLYWDGLHVHVHAVHEVFCEYLSTVSQTLGELTFQSDESVHTQTGEVPGFNDTERNTHLTHTLLSQNTV